VAQRTRPDLRPAAKDANDEPPRQKMRNLVGSREVCAAPLGLGR
jgi:hypothetical protein